MSCCLLVSQSIGTQVGWLAHANVCDTSNQYEPVSYVTKPQIRMGKTKLRIKDCPSIDCVWLCFCRWPMGQCALFWAPPRLVQMPWGLYQQAAWVDGCRLQNSSLIEQAHCLIPFFNLNISLLHKNASNCFREKKPIFFPKERETLRWRSFVSLSAKDGWGQRVYMNVRG